MRVIKAETVDKKLRELLKKQGSERYFNVIDRVCTAISTAAQSGFNSAEIELPGDMGVFAGRLVSELQQMEFQASTKLTVVSIEWPEENH